MATKNTNAKSMAKTTRSVSEGVEVSKTKKETPIREFRDGDYITCHSVTPGGLNINCRSRNYYEFKDYGAESQIEYRDLVELVQKRSEHIYKPRIIIDDADFIAQFKQLQVFYDGLYTSDDLRSIIKMPNNQMVQAIQQLPEGMFETLRSIVSSMVSTGEIDSIKKIRVLSEVFKADFNLISELFGDE